MDYDHSFYTAEFWPSPQETGILNSPDQFPTIVASYVPGVNQCCFAHCSILAILLKSIFPGPRSPHPVGSDLAPTNEEYDEGMSYISEHLSSLRQEITDLRNINTRYSETTDHSPTEQSALELRTTRLLEIKRELSNMLNPPNDPSVWWDKFRKPNRADS